MAPMHTKIMYDLTIVIINKYFEFQNDWLKIIRIRYYSTKPGYFGINFWDDLSYFSNLNDG